VSRRGDPSDPSKPPPSAQGSAKTGARAAAKASSAPRRPPRSSSSRVLQGILDELETAKASLLAATEVLRTVDIRVRAWDQREAFMARRGLALREEAATRFAHALDALHGLLVRLADRGLGAAFGARLTAPGTRRLQAKIRQELRYLQRAFDGGSLLLAKTLRSFGAG
jgi:hypothetical protein